MERHTAFAIGNFYHVYNRGVDKQTIFRNETEYRYFQRSLYTRNSEKRIDSSRVKGGSLHKIDRGNTIVDIIGYALMPNHFHLLLFEKQELGISTFMKKLGTAHSMYINTKYDRSGPVMCRPFRSRCVDTDDYLRWVMSYIHFNPAEILTPVQFSSYPYSSYLDYFDSPREESLILNKAQLSVDISDLEDYASMESICLDSEYLV